MARPRRPSCCGASISPCSSTSPAPPGHTRSREHLIGLLWGRSYRAAARHSLSEALRVIRRHAGQEALEVSVGQIGLAPVRWASTWTSSRSSRRRRGLGRGRPRWSAGEFLEGFGVPDATGFEDWLAAERELWRRRGTRSWCAVPTRRAPGRSAKPAVPRLAGRDARAHLGARAPGGAPAPGRWWATAPARSSCSSASARGSPRSASSPGAETPALVERVRRERGPRRRRRRRPTRHRRARPPLGGRSRGARPAARRRRALRPYADGRAGAAGGRIGSREDPAARGDARPAPARRHVGGGGTGRRRRPGEPGAACSRSRAAA